MNREFIESNLLRMDFVLSLLGFLFIAPYAAYNIVEFVRFMPASTAMGSFWLDLGLLCFINGTVLVAWSNLHKSVVAVR